MIIVVIVGILSILTYPTPDFTLPNILRPPIETIPLDGGWIGFVFLLVNGFLLSVIMAKDGTDITERLLLSVGLGFGVTIVLTILTGILWQISLFVVVLTQITLLAILLFVAYRRGWKPSLAFYSKVSMKTLSSLKPSLIETIVLSVVGLFMAVALYQTIAYPATEWDSLAYGVNYAKIIMEKQSIPLIAGPSVGLEMSASYPPGVQTLAAYLYTFAGNANDFYFRILQPILGLAVMTATYKLAMITTKSRTTSFLAMLTLSAMPNFWQAFVQETYLMCLTLMLVLSSLFFFKAYQSNELEARKYETIGAVFCCFSALTSYVGIFSFGLLFLYSLKKRISAKRFGMLALLAFFIVSLWYLRNLILLGNPLYPFFGIGYYLDPILLSSTAQHFQNWAKVPFYGLFSTISRIGVGLLAVTVIYLIATKRKLFFLIFPSYILLIGLAIMATHIPFIRYLVIAVPVVAVILSESTRFLFTARSVFKRITPVVLIMLIFVLNAAVLPTINSYKPTPTRGDDKWSYLIQVFEEGDAWKWINENTSKDARIATYDIKDYYIEREIFQLDGNESAPLYHMVSIEQAMNFLHEKGVTHILSVPWASPNDTRMPPAYKSCILTGYLGDPRYFPPMYVNRNGTAVYHVGPMNETTITELFNLQGFAPPTNVTIDLTYPSMVRFRMPIPVDYRERRMSVSVNSPKSVYVTLEWNGVVPAEKIRLEPSDSLQFGNTSFVWKSIQKAGNFTFSILRTDGKEAESFEVTLDISFCN